MKFERRSSAQNSDISLFLLIYRQYSLCAVNENAQKRCRDESVPPIKATVLNRHPARQQKMQSPAPIRIDDCVSTAAPVVSVIIPVRDCKDYIGEALESVLSQSFRNFEILVIDDGSSDANYALFGELDARIQVVRLEGSGVSNARNVGMSLARGQYFAFLDADDVWFPGKLTAQLAYLATHPEAGVVFGGFVKWTATLNGVFPPAKSIWDSYSMVAKRDHEKSGWLYTKLLGGLLVGMNTAVVRRSIYEAVGGFNESMIQAEDYDFWLRCSRVTEMHSLECNLALYRIHSASAMHQVHDDCHLALLLISAFNRWGIEDREGNRMTLKEYKLRLGQVYFDHGYLHYWKGKRSVASRSFLTSTINGNRPLRSLIYLFLSLFPRINMNWPFFQR